MKGLEDLFRLPRKLKGFFSVSIPNARCKGPGARPGQEVRGLPLRADQYSPPSGRCSSATGGRLSLSSVMGIKSFSGGSSRVLKSGGFQVDRRAIDDVLHIGQVPAPAARGANAAVVQRLRNSAEVRDARCPD